MSRLFRYLLPLMLFLLSSFSYAANIGDIVSNTAEVSYSIMGKDHHIRSNEVNQTVVGTDATIQFMTPSSTGTESHLLGDSSYFGSDGLWHPMPPPVLADGTVLSTTTPLSLTDTGIYKVDDLAIIKVTDEDRNLDSMVRDTIDVNITSPTGDREEIKLVETGVSTGIFTGYLPVVSVVGSSNDGELYVQAGDNISAAYDNQGAGLRVDSATVVAESKNLKVWIEKQVNKEVASAGEVLLYTLIIHNDENYILREMQVDDHMPAGLRYEEGTAKIEDEKVLPLLSKDGRHLYFVLKSLPAKSSVKITFVAQVGAGVKHTEIVNTAVVNEAACPLPMPKVIGFEKAASSIDLSERNCQFNSNIAQARTRIEEELMRGSGIIVGQVYECSFGKNRKGHGIKGVRLYLEDGTYVLTDENGKYHIEGVGTGTHVVQVDEDMLPEGYSMGENSDNARFAGRHFSQFINMGQGSLRRVDFCLDGEEVRKAGDESGKSKSKVADIYDYHIPTSMSEMPQYSPQELKSNGKDAKILWPPEKYVPAIPSTKIAVLHNKNHKAEVWLNDQKVSMLNYDGKVSDRNSSMVIDTYKGVDLLDQTNTIRVKIIDKRGKTLKTLKRSLHVSNAPVKVEYIERNSFTMADGKHSPVIAVRFIDADGYPLRAGITGTFSVEPPYRSQEALDQLKANPLRAESLGENRYTIDSDGIAYIKLQPTTESGTVALHFKIQGRDEVIRAWLKPQLREWIMVGFAEGTVGYNTLSGHQESLGTLGAEEKVVTEGRVSFFAKGKVKGDWLLTMAYDSGKETGNSRLFDEIDPNKYYTLYNDGSQQNYEAASRKKLYVKVEKERFSALYGDFSTDDMTVTQLSQYSRRLTGLKAEYHGDTFEGVAFVSETDQLFMKDEIRGDGTSGYYYLKNKPIVWNSEKIRIEVRDRYHPERIIETKVLQRFRDYQIDYDRGSLYFKEPIYSNDVNFNPQYIVIDYEIKGDGSKHYTYGGRGAFKTLKGALEIGSSYISEDNAKQQTQLIGVDTKIKIGNNTTFKAEYARTKTTQDGNTTYGNAKFAELVHVANNFYLRAHYREQDHSFGLGQLSGILGGTRQFGLDMTKTFENRLSLNTSAFRNSDLLSGNDEDVFETKVQMDQTLWSAYMGYRYAKNSDSAAAHQLLVGASYAFFDQRLKLSVTHDQTFGANEDKIYPTKTGIGADIALTRQIDLFAHYEWLNGVEKRELGRLGMRYRPWSGMILENTTTSEFGNDITRVYNTMGAVQTYQYNEHWSFSVGYEHGEVLDGNTTGEQVDFDAYRLGVNYKTGNWTAMINGEYRNASIDKKYNLTAGIYTQADDALAFALSAGYSKFEQSLETTEDANIRLSVAYRPEQTEVIVLDKLDLVHQKRNALEDEMFTQKVINNLVVNYTPHERMEISLQHGIKYVKDTINSYEFKGVTQLFGMDLRYDITGKWMVGAQGSLLYVHSADNFDYGTGVYTGYNIFTNMLLIGGYNWEGFEDRDFSLQNYRIEGPYIQFKMKFDQKNLKALVKWMSW